MIAELPEGQTATFRDQLMRGDIRDARRGMVFITAPDGSRRTDGAFLDDLTGRIIRIMLVEWSLPLPLPRNAQGEENAQRILDGLDADTYGALEAAVAPWVNRIITIGKTSWQYVHAATGVTVDVDSPEKAAQLAASGDFTAVDTGPKATRTAITSAASPSGPTLTEQDQTQPNLT